MDNLIKELKKSKKMNKFVRNSHSYKFMKVEDYNKLKPLTYTILIKNLIWSFGFERFQSIKI